MKRAITPIMTLLVVLLVLTGGALAQRGSGRGRGGLGNGRGSQTQSQLRQGQQGQGQQGQGRQGQSQLRQGQQGQGQHGQGRQGQGQHGQGRQGQGGARDTADHNMIQFLLESRHRIRRQVKLMHNGIETLTESDDPIVAKVIKEHVAAMYLRLQEGRPIRMRDPLFRELFRNADKIDMRMRLTPKGMHVVEISRDPIAVRLLHEHAKTVSLFVKNGRAEVRKNHPVP